MVFRFDGSTRAFDRTPTVSDLGSSEDFENSSIEECRDELVLEEKLTTRLVFKSSTFPPTPDTQGINITGYLCHARRSAVDQLDKWEDVSHFDLRSLGVGEHVRIHLGPSKLKAIFETLLIQYKTLGGLASVLKEAGLEVVDSNSVTVLEGTEREILQLLTTQDENFWDNVLELDTRNALETKLLQRRQARRTEALHEFEEHMNSDDWSERQWEEFFKSNEWIFGLGLSYQYVEVLENQGYLGGTNLQGQGADFTDFLMRTSGDTRFTVLVDIKKPDTRLLHSRAYRSHIYRIDSELSGGVAQLQSYCHIWQTEGAQGIRNAPGKLGAYTYAPRGMLIAGNLAEFGDNDEMRQSFELFRRHIHNPQILTFDELYARAMHMVVHYEEDLDMEEADVAPF